MNETPRKVSDFNGDLGKRRAWLASLSMPANDSDISKVLAWPTMERLHQQRDHRAMLLAGWVTSTKPGSMSGTLGPANDNENLYEGWELSSWANSAGDYLSLQPDRRRDWAPSLQDVLSAASRCSVTTTRMGRGRWSAPQRRTTDVAACSDGGVEIVRLGQLEFWNGTLRAWHRNGVRQLPREIIGRPKGHTRAGRSEAAVRSYLQERGVPFEPTIKPYDNDRPYQPWTGPTPQKLAARQELVDLGVSGSVGFEEARARACHSTLLPTAIARGAPWLGGVVASTGKPTLTPTWAAEEEFDRVKLARSIRREIGPHYSEILDLATTRLSARRIGEQFGYLGKYAERWAVREIGVALDKIAA